MKLFKLFKTYGPGVITGAADDDPTGISTYSVVGATTGFSQLWLMVLSTPMLIVVQGMCAKIGYVTKKGLGTVIEERFGFKVALLATFVLIIANIATLSANLLGTAAGFQLVFKEFPVILFLVVSSVIIWYIILFRSYHAIEKVLYLLAIFLAFYILAGFLSKPDWSEVISNTLIPRIDFKLVFFASAVGLLGTTITPFLFYWQTSEEVEEHRNVQEGRKALKTVIPGMIYSNLVSAFIIISTAQTFFKNGIEITSASDAALALTPVVGSFATTVFAIGLVGSGFLSIPVLSASTSYAVSDIFGWNEGLDKKVSRARGFYIVFSLTLLISLIIALIGLDPIKALFYSQVLNGVLSPFLLILIISIAASEKVMGKAKNNIFSTAFGIFTILAISAASIAMFLSL